MNFKMFIGIATAIALFLIYVAYSLPKQNYNIKQNDSAIESQVGNTMPAQSIEDIISKIPEENTKQ